MLLTVENTNKQTSKKKKAHLCSYPNQELFSKESRPLHRNLNVTSVCFFFLSLLAFPQSNGVHE